MNNDWVDYEEYWYRPVLENHGSYQTIRNDSEQVGPFESKSKFKPELTGRIFNRNNEQTIGFKINK